MPAPMIGNLAQSLLTHRQNYDMRTRLDTLSNELSSGRKSDLARSLGPDTGRFSHIDRRLGMLESYRMAATEAAQTMTIAQQVLTSVTEMQQNLSKDLLTHEFSDSAAQRQSRIDHAREVFSGMVSALNTRFADRSVLAGTASDRPALAPAADMIADMEAAVAGLTTVADIEAALDTWFDDPLGGFATMGYTGDTGALATRKIDETESVTMHARADADEVRAVLKSTAKAFIGDSLVLTDAQRSELIRKSGSELIESGEPLYHLAARVGATEARIEQISVRNEAEATSLGQLFNRMQTADPFETATRIQELQLKLETHYTVTARLSRLSLVEYLR